MSEEIEATVLVKTDEQPSLLTLVGAAIQRGVAAEQLEKLLDLQERYESGRAKQAYTRALNAAQADLPIIHKDGRNDFNKKTYATLEGILKVVRPVYLKHGFSLTFGQDATYQRDGWARLYVEVSHVDGHMERYYGEFPLDVSGSKGGNNKSEIQAVGSAFSYGRRYLIGLVFNLVFSDDKDNDGYPTRLEQPRQEMTPGVQRGMADGEDTQRKINPAEIEKLKTAMAEQKKDMQGLLTFFGVDYLPDLKVWQYRKAMKQMGKTP